MDDAELDHMIVMEGAYLDLPITQCEAEVPPWVMEETGEPCDPVTPPLALTSSSSSPGSVGSSGASSLARTNPDDRSRRRVTTKRAAPEFEAYRLPGSTAGDLQRESTRC